MKITIDTDAKTVEAISTDQSERHALYSKEAFELIADVWVKVGWAQRYSYNFTWLGVPIIQLPEDMLRIQEVIYQVQPDVIIETGIARGGSLVFYAGLLELLGKKQVIGVDIEIREHSRRAITGHSLSEKITLVEGSSTDPKTVAAVARCVAPEDKVLVILDSNHTREHVLNELRAYAPLISVGSYAVATDGVMAVLGDVPGGQVSWDQDNPTVAAEDFVAERDDFVLDEPTFVFQESELTKLITYWPGAYVKRVR